MNPATVKDLKQALEGRPDDQVIVIIGGTIFVIDEPETEKAR